METRTGLLSSSVDLQVVIKIITSYLCLNDYKAVENCLEWKGIGKKFLLRLILAKFNNLISQHD